MNFVSCCLRRFVSSWNGILLLQLLVLQLSYDDVALTNKSLHGNNNNNNNNNMWKTTSLIVNAQQQQQMQEDDVKNMSDDEMIEYLFTLSNEELEEICKVRGFQLYKEYDEDTGNEYEFSHEEYVEAAKQCLAIEREMEDILAENPELVDELQAEVDAMNNNNDNNSEITDESINNDETSSERASEVVEEEEPPSTTGDEKETTSSTKEEEDDESSSSIEDDIMKEVIEEEKNKKNKSISSSSSNDDSVNDIHTWPGYIQEFKDAIKADLQLKGKFIKTFIDKTIPPKIQTYIKIGCSKLIIMTKITIIGVYELIKRHVQAYIEGRKQHRQQAEEEEANDDAGLVANEEEDKIQAAAV